MDPFSAPYQFELEPPPPNPYETDLVAPRPEYKLNRDAINGASAPRRVSPIVTPLGASIETRLPAEPTSGDPTESVMSLLQQAESRFLEEREEALARGREEASAEIERAELARREAEERAEAAETTLSALGDIEARVSQLLAEARTEADRAVTEAERLASLQQEAAQRLAEDRVGELLGEAQGHATELMHMAEREARRLRQEGITRDLQFVDEIETELNEVMITQVSSLQASRSVLDEATMSARQLREQAVAAAAATNHKPGPPTANGWVTPQGIASLAPYQTNGYEAPRPEMPGQEDADQPGSVQAGSEAGAPAPFDDPFAMLGNEDSSGPADSAVHSDGASETTAPEPAPPVDIFSPDRSSWGPDDLAALRQAMGTDLPTDDLWPPLPEEGVDMHARDLARLNSDTRRAPRNGRGWGIRRGSA